MSIKAKLQKIKNSFKRLDSSVAHTKAIKSHDTRFDKDKAVKETAPMLHGPMGPGMGQGPGRI